MELKNTFFATGLAEWRQWLAQNYASCKEVWLVFSKVSTGQKCISYSDALDEALCYGWIDSLIQRIDDERYARKFTPRTNTAKWSLENKKRVQRLVAKGRMLPAGLAVLPSAEELTDLAPRTRLGIDDLPELLTALQGQAQALATWEKLPPSHQARYVGWISSAKRPETRVKRIEEALGMLAEGKRLEGK